MWSIICHAAYVAGKLYRADIIKSKNIRFDNELSYNEDRLFCVTYLCAVTNKVAYTTRPAYNYYQRKGSLMNSLSNCYNPKYLSDFNAYLKMLNEVKQIKTNIPIKRWVKTGLCLSYKTIINMMISGKCYDKNAHHFMLGKLIRSGGIFNILEWQWWCWQRRFCSLYIRKYFANSVWYDMLNSKALTCKS